MTVFLETERLYVKAPSLDELPKWLTLYAASEIRTLSTETIQEWLLQDMQHFKKYGFSMGSVYEKRHDQFIGRGGLVYLDYDETQPDIEVGYELHPSYWGKGYATELAKASLNWGFEHLSLAKLVAVTRPDNKRSQRVLSKIGMRYVKVMQFKGEDFFYYEIFNPYNLRR